MKKKIEKKTTEISSHPTLCYRRKGFSVTTASIVIWWALAAAILITKPRMLRSYLLHILDYSEYTSTG